MPALRTVVPQRTRGHAPRLVFLVLAGWLSGASGAQAVGSPPRQTAFDENNYQPREIVNRLPPPPAAATTRTTRSPPTKTVTRSAKWSWRSRQVVERGTFQWREHNGRIDYASVCMNEQAGSLRYRDCRRGAKPAFAKLCKARRDSAACHAQNNYSPLR
ncbi:hypothetical protein KRX52_11260 [Pseudomonas sp. MAP12]|uniref:Uncharacterized protein n=1 Tax=Geopseudomonas aromaticivorans TaxID=2849492 RepID=A0ABS6MX48_9GAMM|nr:hypothetical protein [Pseudomonas aromaticivorans]MBV2133372.1 hypothetical protein [Pseudomonas aromaticivorans]